MNKSILKKGVIIFVIILVEVFLTGYFIRHIRALNKVKNQATVNSLFLKNMPVESETGIRSHSVQFLPERSGAGTEVLDLTRDPFWQKPQPPVIIEPVIFQLDGIMCGLHVPSAVINDQVVVEGDVIKGYTVESITPFAVELRCGEDKRVLNFEKTP